MALSLPFTLGSILVVSDVLSAVSPLSVILIRYADRVNGGRHRPPATSPRPHQPAPEITPTPSINKRATVDPG